jgi:hypothetical protein
LESGTAAPSQADASSSRASDRSAAPFSIDE